MKKVKNKVKTRRYEEKMKNFNDFPYSSSLYLIYILLNYILILYMGKLNIFLKNLIHLQILCFKPFSGIFLEKWYSDIIIATDVNQSLRMVVLDKIKKGV